MTESTWMRTGGWEPISRGKTSSVLVHSFVHSPKPLPCPGSDQVAFRKPETPSYFWRTRVQRYKNCTTLLGKFTFTFHFHALEKEMATHSSVFAWRIPGTGEPGGLPSMGSHRVGQDWSDLAAAAAAAAAREVAQENPMVAKRKLV